MCVSPGADPDSVEGEVLGDAHTPGLPILDFIHVITAIPYPDKNFLNDIFGFLFIAQDPESKSKKLVFDRYYPVLKRFEIHPLKFDDRTMIDNGCYNL
jgi:hypothetical protein